MNRPFVFISELPALNTLECYTATAAHKREQEVQEKCRELARGDSAILTSPISEEVRFSYRAATLQTAAAPSTPHNQCNLVLIAKVGYLRNEKLQVKLRQQGLVLVSQITATDEIMASCYSFSLKARLSPKWNRVSTWLVQGLEFLHGGRVKAVELHVAVNNGELALTIHTKILVLSRLQPEDLGVSLPLLDKFNSGARKKLSEEEMEGRKCYILPNCTLGFVHSVSTEYTPVSLLPSYEHIRLYWKKQYGYILPEKEKLNFKIYFKRNPGMILSYPGSCVLKCPPHSFPTRESNSIATSFLSDALQRLPSICSYRLSFATKCFASKSQLQCASSTMLGSLKQVQMPLKPITSSSAKGSAERDTACTLAGAKRSAASLVNSSVDQIVPGKHNGGSGSGGGSVASAQCAGSTEKAAQPNKTAYVPKFGPLMKRAHTTPAPPTVSATAQPPAKKPAYKQSAPTSTPTIQKPVQPPARGPPQAPTVPHPGASVAPNHIPLPATDRLQPTQTTPHRPNNTAQNCPSAAAGGGATASKSGTTQAKGTGPFQQVPTNLMSGVEDDDAFYPAMHSKRNQSTGAQEPMRSLPQNETSVALAKQVSVSKAKVADLKKWLWQNGVQFKTKGTKKEDLVRLVMEHTRQTGKAFEVL